MSYTRDTIAAKATPPGKGGIGIIRISGPLASTVAVEVLGRLPKARYATHGNFLDGDGAALDSGIAIYFPAPHSFTGEDVLELQGHGGPVVLDMLLNRVVGLGARIANPGEFSQRAFLNDKLDLAQAEAIADLINSSTEKAARGALRSLQGDFSRLINELLAEVIELRVFVEASIDFPDEEIDFLEDHGVSEKLVLIGARIDSILQEATQGAILVEGASVALVGKPNAGKSSLMNCLTGKDTSIVTHIPGTTRDTVDDIVQLDGLPLKVIDTAGIRASTDQIEAEGVRRAVEAARQADLTIAVVDASLESELRTQHLDELVGKLEGQRRDAVIVVLNKIDLVEDLDSLCAGEFREAVCLSAKTGQGLDVLKQRLKTSLGFDEGFDSNFTARSRHVTALKAAAAAVKSGSQVLAETQAGELLAEELKSCQDALSEVTGNFTADDLLGEIFGSFCIGK